MTINQFKEVYKTLTDWNYDRDGGDFPERNNTEVTVNAGKDYIFDGHDFEDFNCEIDDYDPDDHDVMVGCNTNNVVTYIPISEVKSIQIRILPNTEEKKDSVEDLLKEIFPEGVKGTIKQSEKEMILATLIECNGNKTKAAEKLGISIRTLHRRLVAYNIK